MNIQFAERMKDYEEGIFQVLNEKKDEAEKQGKKIYNLSVGTPDFPPAQHIMDAVITAAQKPENYKYALVDIPELITAVQSRYEKRYGVLLEKDEIMSVYGSQEGIAHICMTLCNAGDVVLVPNPGYPIFGIGPSLAGADVQTYDLTEENHYLPDLDSMDVEFVMELVEKTGVLCTPGSSFGTLGKGHVRFALTMTAEKIREAVAAIAVSGMIKK